MDAKSRQQALDNISREELAKIQAHQARTSGAFKVDDEWLLLTEFAKAFGWQAYLDVKADKIDTAEMMTLIEANRRLEYMQMFRDAQASFVGCGSAQSKSPAKTFRSLTDSIIKKVRAN